jgi:hypothetical protein
MRRVNALISSLGESNSKATISASLHFHKDYDTEARNSDYKFLSPKVESAK